MGNNVQYIFLYGNFVGWGVGLFGGDLREKMVNSRSIIYVWDMDHGSI